MTFDEAKQQIAELQTGLKLALSDVEKRDKRIAELEKQVFTLTERNEHYVERIAELEEGLKSAKESFECMRLFETLNDICTDEIVSIKQLLK